MGKTKKKKKKSSAQDGAQETAQDMICEMCGVQFVGTGGVCSTECADAWVKTYIDGPWKREAGQ